MCLAELGTRKISERIHQMAARAAHRKPEEVIPLSKDELKEF
jgi:hypothetical protein